MKMSTRSVPFAGNRFPISKIKDVTIFKKLATGECLSLPAILLKSIEYRFNQRRTRVIKLPSRTLKVGLQPGTRFRVSVKPSCHTGFC